MNFKHLIAFIVMVIICSAGFWIVKRFRLPPYYAMGKVIDSFNGVSVFYNGGVSNISGRNYTADGYNLGLKYQCVEFVKRYYYQHLNHKMPDSYGNARDFYDTHLRDSEKNKKRNLIQYSNYSEAKPEVSDLLIFSGSSFNKYGHVAIICKVTGNEIQVIQQNPGPFGQSRERFALFRQNNKWIIDHNRVLGRLRKD